MSDFSSRYTEVLEKYFLIRFVGVKKCNEQMSEWVLE